VRVPPPPPPNSHTHTPLTRIQSLMFAPCLGPQKSISYHGFDSSLAVSLQVYALLAVNARQLAPSTISLKVSEEGDFGVSRLRLHKKPPVSSGGEESEPTTDWFTHAHSTVLADIDTITKNPLYSNNCTLTSGCPERHWTCPFLLSSLFGGSARARRTHPRVQLLTPGLKRLSCDCIVPYRTAPHRTAPHRYSCVRRHRSN